MSQNKKYVSAGQAKSTFQSGGTINGARVSQSQAQKIAKDGGFAGGVYVSKNHAQNLMKTVVICKKLFLKI